MVEKQENINFSHIERSIGISNVYNVIKISDFDMGLLQTGIVDGIPYRTYISKAYWLLFSTAKGPKAGEIRIEYPGGHSGNGGISKIHFEEMNSKDRIELWNQMKEKNKITTRKYKKMKAEYYKRLS